MDAHPRVDIETLLANGRWVRALAIRLVGNADVADDIVQQAWLAALKNPPKREGSARAWLRTVVRRLAAQTHRDQYLRRKHETKEQREAHVPIPSELAEIAEQQRQVVAHVLKLEEPYQSSILYRYFHDLTPSEIARQLGVPAATVRSWLRRALTQLRERIQAAESDGRPLALVLLPLLALPARPARVAGLAAGAVTTGGLLMSAKKLAGAAVVLLILLGGMAFLGGPEQSSSDREQEAKTGPHDDATKPDQARETGLLVARDPLPHAAARLFVEGADRQIDRDLDLFGRVVSEDGSPISAALIETIHRPWRRVGLIDPKKFFESTAGPKSESDADGQFSLRLKRGQLVELHVSAPGFAHTSISKCVAGEKLEVVLSGEAQLEVLTIDEEGRPIGGVQVLIRNMDFGRSSQTFVGQEGVTDSEGSVVFGNLAAGSGYLQAVHPDLGLSSEDRFEISTSARKTVELLMSRGRVVTGHVRDVETHQPIVGARVGYSLLLERSVSTDSQGYYEFPSWTGNGSPQLHASSDGYGQLGVMVPLEGPVDFDLRRGDDLGGRVVGPTGEPVPNAFITAMGVRQVQGVREFDSRSTISGSDGRFDLTSVRVDLPHTLVVTAIGYGRTLLDFDHSHSIAGHIALGDIEVPVGSSIEGIVVDVNGDALARVAVSVSGQNDDRRRLRPGQAELSSKMGYGEKEERFTDDLGRFRFPDLSPGTYEIVVKVEGRFSSKEEVVLLSETDMTDLRFELKTGRSLRIRVERSNGDAISGVTVYLRADLDTAKSETDLDGYAVFDELSSTKVGVMVGTSGYMYAQTPPSAITPEGQTVTVVMEKAELVEGRVVSPSGKPLRGMYVEALFAGTAPDTGAYTNDNGSFQILAPANSRLVLRVAGARKNPPGSVIQFEHTAWRGELLNISAPASELEIRARRIVLDSSLTVAVVDADGAPVDSAVVHVFGPNVPWPVSETKTETGSYHFGELPGDEVTVLIILPPDKDFPVDALSPEPFKVVPTGQTLTLSLRRGIVISGRVLDETGAPVDHALIQATPPQNFFTFSSADGKFSLAIPPDSVIDLKATLHVPEGAPRTGVVEGVSRSSGEVTIRLSK